MEQEEKQNGSYKKSDGMLIQGLQNSNYRLDRYDETYVRNIGQEWLLIDPASLVYLLFIQKIPLQKYQEDSVCSRKVMKNGEN